MNINVKLFAIIKERLATDSINVQLPEDSDVGSLRKQIAEQFSEVADIMQHVLIAVDTQIANPDHPLTENSEVAIIPPVSGG